MFRLLALISFSLFFVPSAYAYSSVDDPFGDYSPFEGASVGIGPQFFEGHFNDDFKTSIYANFQLHMPVIGPLIALPTLAGGFTSSQDGDTAKLYFDHSLRFRLRVLPRPFKVQPYIEGGFGWIGLDGIDFQLIGGGGIDFYTFQGGGGAIGIQVMYQSILANRSISIPALVTFTRRF